MGLDGPLFAIEHRSYLSLMGCRQPIDESDGNIGGHHVNFNVTPLTHNKPRQPTYTKILRIQRQRRMKPQIPKE